MTAIIRPQGMHDWKTVVNNDRSFCP